MTEKLDGLCDHGRLETAYCGECITEYSRNPLFIKDSGRDSGGGSAEYYDLPDNCSSVTDVIVEKNMNWCQANIFKAAYRWDKKPDLMYNLDKIIWFANYAKQRLQD